MFNFNLIFNNLRA